jgi:hypothetical protein
MLLRGNCIYKAVHQPWELSLTGATPSDFRSCSETSPDYGLIFHDLSRQILLRRSSDLHSR